MPFFFTPWDVSFRDPIKCVHKQPLVACLDVWPDKKTGKNPTQDSRRTKERHQQKM